MVEEPDKTKLWTASAKQILALAALKLAALGFRRTKPTFFVRERPHWCEFIHAHKFVGGRSFRLHTGLRVLASPRDFCVLDGPQTFPGDRRFFLSFVNTEVSWERCAQQFEAFATLVAVPWFEAWNSPEALLGEGTPLDAADRSALQEALQGVAAAERVARSRGLLGLIGRPPIEG